MDKLQSFLPYLFYLLSMLFLFLSGKRSIKIDSIRTSVPETQLEAQPEIRSEAQLDSSEQKNIKNPDVFLSWLSSLSIDDFETFFSFLSWSRTFYNDNDEEEKRLLSRLITYDVKELDSFLSRLKLYFGDSKNAS